MELDKNVPHWTSVGKCFEIDDWWWQKLSKVFLLEECDQPVDVPVHVPPELSLVCQEKRNKGLLASLRNRNPIWGENVSFLFFP